MAAVDCPPRTASSIAQRAIPTLSEHTAHACQRLAADPAKPTCGNPAGFSASPNFSHFSFAA
jgi:hypothetical protein